MLPEGRFRKQGRGHECSDERLDQQHERHELSFAPDWAALLTCTAASQDQRRRCEFNTAPRGKRKRSDGTLQQGESGLWGKHKPAVRYSLSGVSKLKGTYERVGKFHTEEVRNNNSKKFR